MIQEKEVEIPPNGGKKKAIDRDLVFVDLETSGLDSSVHEILEIGLMRTSPDGKEIRSTFQSLVLPTHIETANPQALIVNEYDPGLWAAKACPLSSALDAFMNMCFGGGVTLVAHNVSFDWSFLQRALRESELLPDLDYHLICTASMAWPLVMQGKVESPKLEKLCAYFNISNEGAHRAMADVERMRAVYCLLLERDEVFSSGAGEPEPSRKDKVRMLRMLHDAEPALIHESCGCPYVPSPLGGGLCPDPSLHDAVGSLGTPGDVS